MSDYDFSVTVYNILMGQIKEDPNFSGGQKVQR